MALFKNRLLSGALFAGALFAGQTDEVDQAQESGRAQQLRPHYEKTQTKTAAPLSPGLKEPRDNQPVSSATLAGLVEPGGFPASVDLPASAFDSLLFDAGRKVGDGTAAAGVETGSTVDLLDDDSRRVNPPLIAGLTDDEAAFLLILLAAEV
ncbi:MAG: hypothetical protein KGZ88_11870 [Methylomicrobium sp.]|nr:hypothetical protein [Methylomicrobium sp.]